MNSTPNKTLNQIREQSKEKVARLRQEAKMYIKVMDLLTDDRTKHMASEEYAFLFSQQQAVCDDINAELMSMQFAGI